MAANRLTGSEILGITRPAKGPYPPGVSNGPLPITPRGIRRRKQHVAASLATHSIQLGEDIEHSVQQRNDTTLPEESHEQEK